VHERRRLGCNSVLSPARQPPPWTQPAAFVHKGLIFISVNIDCHRGPDGNHPRDVAKSVRWLTTMPAIRRRSEPVYSDGHSAGAQLAALLCTDYVI